MKRLLTAKDFAPGEEKCLEVVRALRWSNGKKKYAVGDVHINNAENRFSFLKSWYRKFRGLCRKHLGLWINFFETLLNIKSSIVEKTISLLSILVCY